MPDADQKIALDLLASDPFEDFGEGLVSPSTRHEGLAPWPRRRTPYRGAARSTSLAPLMSDASAADLENLS